MGECEDTERKFSSDPIKVPSSGSSVNCKYIARRAELAIAKSHVV